MFAVVFTLYTIGTALASAALKSNVKVSKRMAHNTFMSLIRTRNEVEHGRKWDVFGSCSCHAQNMPCAVRCSTPG